MHRPKYCLFFDNHTMRACPDVGAAFDPEEYAGRISDCGVDFITFHARCNQGFAYYDTRIGIRHPTLGYDLFGRLIEACGRRGIAVSAYLNGGISNEEGLLHRDWTTLYPDGRSLRQPPLTPFVRTMCYNSGYHDHLVSMVGEIAGNYPVAGFFIDCLGSHPCVCPICVGLMKEQKIDWQDEKAVVKFSAQSVLRLIGDISRQSKLIRPEALLYFNGPGLEEQRDTATYFEVECLPSNPAWGYNYLPVMVRYMRTIDDRPLLNMTGRFYDWGDFGGLRPQAAIEYDVLFGLANGARPNIGCHFHPRGTCNHAVFDRVEAVYKNLHRYEPWFDGAKPVTEIAICFPKEIDEIRIAPELRGCVQMLGELKHQFDVVTECSDWDRYRLLVLPDTVVLTESVADRLRRYLTSGGIVISSGRSGLDLGETRFVLDDWGIDYGGTDETDPPYFKPCEAFRDNLPEMPLALYEKGIVVHPRPETEIGANLIAPYYNRHWDGIHAYYYLPPDRELGHPLLTTRGNVAHFSHPIFTAYRQIASIELRQIFANVIARFLPKPMLRVEGLPSFARAFVTSQPGRIIVHLLAYVPELRGTIEMIEEPVTAVDVKVAIRIDDITLTNVTLAPCGEALPFEILNGYAEILLPVLHGYAMIVFE